MNDIAEGAGRQKTDYLSYLLRLWRESEKGVDWRVSLASPQTGERLGFANLDDLFGYLRRQTGAAPDIGEGQDAGQKRGGDDATSK